MAKKKTDNTICGKTPEAIRSAYFGGKLNVLLAEIMGASKPSDAEIKRLGEELVALRLEEADTADKIRQDFKGVIPGTEPKPPTVEELQSGVSDAEWREKADKATAYIETKMDEVRQKVASKEKLAGSYWLDTAAIILSYKGLLDRDRVFKDQLFRARLTALIEQHGISRKEAEEYAKLTPEYAAYKNATLLDERIIEFINLAKKKDAEQARPY